MTSKLRGPFGGVFAIAGPASIVRLQTAPTATSTRRSATAGAGCRPTRRIPSDDRWDIVNYVRYLNDQTSVAAAAEGTAQ